MPNRNILKFVREQVKEHSFGKLVFLTCVGPRAWGFAPDSINCDYQGIYLSKEDNTYWLSVSGAGLDNYKRSIALLSLERIISCVFHGDIDFFVFINSPPIYISKEFSEFRKWANSNFSKQIYSAYQTRQNFGARRQYLNDFFFTGNGIAILEQKKVIANLPELNKKNLKIPAIDKIIEEEKARLPFESKRICEEIRRKLKARLKEANKKSRLPAVADPKKLSKLKIMKKVNPYFWYWPEGSRKK